MGALSDFKCTCDSTLVYVCQADAEKCIFVWTILSQTPRRTPQVTSDAGRISARIFLLFPKERRMLRKRDYHGRLSFHFFDGARPQLILLYSLIIHYSTSYYT